MKKPRAITLGERGDKFKVEVDEAGGVIDSDGSVYLWGPSLRIGGTYLAKLSDVKRLRTYLERAIEYLEANKHKRGPPL